MTQIRTIMLRRESIILLCCFIQGIIIIMRTNYQYWFIKSWKFDQMDHFFKIYFLLSRMYSRKNWFEKTKGLISCLPFQISLLFFIVIINNKSIWCLSNCRTSFPNFKQKKQNSRINLCKKSSITNP